MAGLVPEPNPSLRRVRERGRGRGQKLLCGSQWALELRTVCPQGHAHCLRWGTHRVFLFFGRFWSWPCDPSAKPRPVEGEREGVWERANCFGLAVGARAAPRPQGHARCLRWGSHRDFLLFGRFWSWPCEPSAKPCPAAEGDGYPGGASGCTRAQWRLLMSCPPAASVPA
jgi:hypothetical protein